MRSSPCSARPHHRAGEAKFLLKRGAGRCAGHTPRIRGKIGATRSSRVIVLPWLWRMPHDRRNESGLKKKAGRTAFGWLRFRAATSKQSSISRRMLYAHGKLAKVANCCFRAASKNSDSLSELHPRGCASDFDWLTVPFTLSPSKFH